MAVLETGGADWVVRPTDAGYPDDERVFVAHLLETIDGAVAAVPEAGIETANRERWVGRRTNELECGELVFVAHNLDVLARRS